MKKIMTITAGIAWLALSNLQAQVIIKTKMGGVADAVAPPPKSLKEAYQLSHTKDAGGFSVNTRQELYEEEKGKIDKVIALIDADSYKEEKMPDPTDMLKAARNEHPDMQAAMKAFYTRLQNDSKLAAEFDAMNEKQQEKYIQDYVVANGVKLSDKPVEKSKATQTAESKGKEMQMISKWMEELGKETGSRKGSYYQKLIQGDDAEHRRLDTLEQRELMALPIKQMGEYSGPDPAREKEIMDRYFTMHMKVAENQLGNDINTWNLYKQELVNSYGKFDKKLEALDWGNKLSSNQMKTGLAEAQRNLLYALSDLLECDQKITFRAASWYSNYLNRKK